MRYLPYNKNNKDLSKELRKNSTKGEVLLWNVLKAGKMKGFTFNRQKPIGKFIVDFYCKPLKLVIEVDGISHSFAEVAEKDYIKQDYLESIGITVIRFTEKEIIFHRSQVTQAIYTQIELLEKT